MVSAAVLVVSLIALGMFFVAVSGSFLALRCTRLAACMGITGIFAGGVVGALGVALPEMAGSLGPVMAGESPGVGAALLAACVVLNVMLIVYVRLRPISLDGVGLAVGHRHLVLLGVALAVGIFLPPLVSGGPLPAGPWTGALGILIHVAGLGAMFLRRGLGGDPLSPVAPDFRFRSGLLLWVIVWVLLIGMVAGGYLVVAGAGLASLRYGLHVGLVEVMFVALLFSVPEGLLVFWARRRLGDAYVLAALLGSVCLSLLSVSFVDMASAGQFLWRLAGAFGPSVGLPFLALLGGLSVGFFIPGLSPLALRSWALCVLAASFLALVALMATVGPQPLS